MSETPTDPQPSTEPQGADPAGGEPANAQPNPEASPAQETDWKVEARKWESLAKKNKDAADKLAEIEEASKTEAQKMAEELEALRKENEVFKADKQIAAWKAEVSTETGIPAAALAGSTKEEIEAHAETLKPLIEAAKLQAEPARPGVVPTIGKTPETPANISLDDQIAVAEKDGDSARVRQLKALKLGELSAN